MINKDQHVMSSNSFVGIEAATFGIYQPWKKLEVGESLPVSTDWKFILVVVENGTGEKEPHLAIARYQKLSDASQTKLEIQTDLFMPTVMAWCPVAQPSPSVLSYILWGDRV